MAPSAAAAASVLIRRGAVRRQRWLASAASPTRRGGSACPPIGGGVEPPSDAVRGAAASAVVGVASPLAPEGCRRAPRQLRPLVRREPYVPRRNPYRTYGTHIIAPPTSRNALDRRERGAWRSLRPASLPFGAKTGDAEAEAAAAAAIAGDGRDERGDAEEDDDDEDDDIEQVQTRIQSLDRGLQLSPPKLKAKCLEVLEVLQGHQHGWVFNSPVDPVELGLPDYFQVIKRPMDLGTIKKRLEDGRYRALEEFEADVRLTFDNAMLYNPEGSVVYNMADEMKAKFAVDYAALIRRLDEEEEEEGGGPEEEGGDEAERRPRKGRRKRSPSVLLGLPQPFTTAQALALLTRTYKKGTPIRLDDFRALAAAARRGEPRNAAQIHHALREFRRCNGMSVDVHGSRVAMEGMVRAMMPAPEEGEATPQQRAEAILYALDAFAYEKTGLYFAYRTEGIDYMLMDLLGCVRSSGGAIRLPEGFDHLAEEEEEEEDKKDEEEDESDAASGADDEGDREGSDRDGDEEEEAAASRRLAVRILRVTSAVVKAVVRRGFRPDRHMKKRAARKYRKALRLSPEEGNASPRTARTGVEIALELGGTARCAKDMVLTPYRAARNKPDQETLDLVARKKAEEWDLVVRKKAEEWAERKAVAEAARRELEALEAEAAEAEAAEAEAKAEAGEEAAAEEEAEVVAEAGEEEEAEEEAAREDGNDEGARSSSAGSEERKDP